MRQSNIDDSNIFRMAVMYGKALSTVLSPLGLLNASTVLWCVLKASLVVPWP